MSNQAKLQNLILDFLYKQVCLKKSNAEIIRMLESKGMPPMDEDGLNLIRQRFKETEQKKPEKMAEFRKRLQVA